MKRLKDIKIAIVSSVFRKEVSTNLEKNCLKTLKAKGLKDSQIEVFQVPGSWEIPLIVKKLAKKGGFDAIITFGGVVKGKTYHFEQIANEVARSLMDISLEYEIPVIFEVLAVYNLKDAIERATRKEENKGVEAAQTALEMIKIMKEI
ncbi:6,7-dimethyl-8-ribityllumazine synthase [Candidatus Gottesmanbacteria bacterium]|nr:6,7-dimethyl-8-ribityllumazine synthase [Candidatus Gottesmanbacteria bacterium]